MKKSNRQILRSWISNNSTLYSIGKSTHRTYCKVTGPIHTLPNFLIIGAAKGGTSSLYDYLIQHPNVFSCIIKEPNYFSMYFDRSAEWYRSFFPFSFSKYYFEKIKKKKFVTGEASTEYYWHPHAPKRAQQIVPNAKIIFLLRNPADRAFSHYQMCCRAGIEQLSFEEAIKREEERTSEEYQKMLKDEYYFSAKFSSYAYIRKSIYIDFIQNWMKYFPKEQFMFIKSESFFENPGKILNDVLKFLELPELKLSQYKITRQGIYEKMDNKIRNKLLTYFKPHNEKLYKFLDSDFGWER